MTRAVAANPPQYRKNEPARGHRAIDYGFERVKIPHRHRRIKFAQRRPYTGGERSQREDDRTIIVKVL
jgi:hypothetical protein